MGVFVGLTSLAVAGKKDRVVLSSTDACEAAINDENELYECQACVSLKKKRDYIYDTRTEKGFCERNVVLVLTDKKQCDQLGIRDEKRECRKCVEGEKGNYLYDTKENEGACHPSPR